MKEFLITRRETMKRNYINYFMVLLVLLLIGCQKSELITSKYCNDAQMIEIFGEEATYQRTYIIYHNKDIVSKFEIIDEFIFEPGHDDIIREYQQFKTKTYLGDIFNFEGFSESSNIENNVFTTTMVMDYEIMDMNELIEEENWFVKAKDIVNTENKVEFDKLEKLVLEDGYFKPVE